MTVQMFGLQKLLSPNSGEPNNVNLRYGTSALFGSDAGFFDGEPNKATYATVICYSARTQIIPASITVKSGV